MSKFVHVHCDVNEMFQREWPKWILNENPMEWKNNAQKGKSNLLFEMNGEKEPLEKPQNKRESSGLCEA